MSIHYIPDFGLNIQLPFEQHRLDLNRFTYAQIFFNIPLLLSVCN